MLVLVFYIYTYVGLSALLVSTIRAMRRPFYRGTSDRTGSTFFVYANHFFVASLLVAYGIDDFGFLSMGKNDNKKLLYILR